MSRNTHIPSVALLLLHCVEVMLQRRVVGHVGVGVKAETGSANRVRQASSPSLRAAGTGAVRDDGNGASRA